MVQSRTNFRDHGQVDGNGVALADAPMPEQVCQAADLLMRLPVRDVAHVALIILKDERDLRADPAPQNTRTRGTADCNDTAQVRGATCGSSRT